MIKNKKSIISRTTSFLVCIIIIMPVISAKDNINKKDYDLEILNFQGGRDLNFTVINKDNNVITNIEIKLNIEGGGVVLPRLKQFEIPILKPGESIQLRIKLYGFGIGKLLKFFQNL